MRSSFRVRACACCACGSLCLLCVCVLGTFACHLCVCVFCAAPAIGDDSWPSPPQPNGTQFHYVWSIPSAAVGFSVRGSKYLFAADPSMTFTVGGSASLNPPGIKPPFSPGTVATLAEWQALTGGADQGATASTDVDVTAAVHLAEQMLQLPP